MARDYDRLKRDPEYRRNLERRKQTSKSKRGSLVFVALVASFLFFSENNSYKKRKQTPKRSTASAQKRYTVEKRLRFLEKENEMLRTRIEKLERKIESSPR